MVVEVLSWSIVSLRRKIIFQRFHMPLQKIRYLKGFVVMLPLLQCDCSHNKWVAFLIWCQIVILGQMCEMLKIKLDDIRQIPMEPIYVMELWVSALIRVNLRSSWWISLRYYFSHVGILQCVNPDNSDRKYWNRSSMSSEWPMDKI